MITVHVSFSYLFFCAGQFCIITVKGNMWDAWQPWGDQKLEHFGRCLVLVGLVLFLFNVLYGGG